MLSEEVALEPGRDREEKRTEGRVMQSGAGGSGARALKQVCVLDLAEAQRGGQCDLTQ